jgi:hypothetical protein
MARWDGIDTLADSKAKILGYELGNPKTYVVNPKVNFPVTSRYVDAPVIPKPRQTVFYNWKPAEPKVVRTPKAKPAKRLDSKTVTKPRVLLHVVNVTVCACGTPISQASTGMCLDCSNRSRNTGRYTTVCPTCKGIKAKQAKQCRPCADKARTTHTTVCPRCGGTKVGQAKHCKPCYLQTRYNHA